jgi:hypothetical protein
MKSFEPDTAVSVALRAGAFPGRVGSSRQTPASKGCGDRRRDENNRGEGETLPILGIKFIALGHNTERGAAGASVLNAELAYVKGALALAQEEYDGARLEERLKDRAASSYERRSREIAA